MPLSHGNNETSVSIDVGWTSITALISSTKVLIDRERPQKRFLRLPDFVNKPQRVQLTSIDMPLSHVNSEISVTIVALIPVTKVF